MTLKELERMLNDEFSVSEFVMGQPRTYGNQPAFRAMEFAGAQLWLGDWMKRHPEITKANKGAVITIDGKGPAVVFRVRAP